MQRIVVKFVAALEYAVENEAVVFHVALHHRAGEFVLVLEVIKEAGLRDADRGDEFVDRGRGEAFRKHGIFRRLKKALARFGAFAGPGIEHAVTVP